MRVDNLQQGAAFHFTKYAAFFDPPPHKAAEDRKGLGGGEGKNFDADVSAFSREKKFFSSPRFPSTLVGNSAFPKNSTLFIGAPSRPEPPGELHFFLEAKAAGPLPPFLPPRFSAGDRREGSLQWHPTVPRGKSDAGEIL